MSWSHSWKQSSFVVETSLPAYLHYFNFILFFQRSLVLWNSCSSCNLNNAFPTPTVDDPYDYLGRSYLHVPQDVETDLRTDEPPDKCYAPKKLVHSWYGTGQEGVVLMSLDALPSTHSLCSS